MLVLCAVLVPVVLFGAVAESDDEVRWPAFRGAGQGKAAAADLPLDLGSTQNLRWKRPLPGPGNSSPVVWGARLFLTQATDEGRRRWTYCLDLETGALRWEREVVHAEPEPTHKTNPFCSATPATDGERVIVSHGSAGVVCYDLDGEEQWTRELGPLHHIWGNANSPVIWGDLCFLNCGPGVRTFVLALDKKTGETIWKIDVPGGLEGGDQKTWIGSWSTPVVGREGGRDVLYVALPHFLYALDPATGDERWKCGGLGPLVYTSPLLSEEVVVVTSGYAGPAIAVRKGGAGDVTDSHRLWRHERTTQRIGSGTIHDDHVYLVNENGVAMCLDLESGKTVWKERMTATNWTSLVQSGDRLYSADEDGQVVVFRAGPEAERLAAHSLEELVRASMAVAGKALLVRTYQHLWCFAEPGEGD